MVKLMKYLINRLEIPDINYDNKRLSNGKYN